MGSTGFRSDYYVMLENASDNDVAGLPEKDSEGTSSVVSSGGYTSYQGGYRGGRYIPSIYQSDGTPQFWGGHIYRPTQAAVAMTNR